jgi:hypothetical protein
MTVQLKEKFYITEKKSEKSANFDGSSKKEVGQLGKSNKSLRPEMHVSDFQ